MWKSLILFGSLLGLTLAGCPMLNQYLTAKTAFEQEQIKQQTLLNKGLVSSPDQPGAVLFLTYPAPAETALAYNLSTHLVLAQQAYSQNFNPKLQTQEYCFPKTLRCTPEVTPACNASSPWRSLSGLCNNVQNPKWGGPYTPLNRIGKAQYSDGVFDLRKSVQDEPLPAVREVSNVVFQTSTYSQKPQNRPLVNFNFLTQGEYLVVDMQQRQRVQDNTMGFGLRCCTADNKIPSPNETYFGCAPFEYATDDPVASQYNRTCSPYIRTQPMFQNDCTLKGSSPTNGVTHFMDNSNIYGNNDTNADSFRSFVGGKLQIVNGVLPVTENCFLGLFGCYNIGGGVGGTNNPTMSLIHSVMVRLHNNIADQLSKLNPQHDDEQLFQQSRRIQIALYQHLIYDEWLPLLFGQDYVEDQGLSCSEDLYCGVYDSNVNPSILTEFGHAAFPQFHGILPETVNFYDENLNITDSFDVISYQIGPQYLETKYNNALRALLLTEPCYGKFQEVLKNNLFHGVGSIFGLDLLSSDMFRGRDHGHSPYYYYKNLCTPYEPLTSWEDLEGVIADDHLALLQTVYTSVFDLDLYVGMALEIRQEADYLGPVGQCIVTEQFKRTKFGDRFFYAFEDGPYPFTPDQMTEIKNYSFAKHYCTNVNITQMLPHPLELPNDNNQFTDCSQFGTLDLSAWKE